MRNNKLRTKVADTFLNAVPPAAKRRRILKNIGATALALAHLFILMGYTHGSFFDTRYNYRNMAETVKKLKVEQEYCHRHFVQSSFYPMK